MASVDAGSQLQAQIQAAVQPKLMENGWVVEENDTTLSEYVTMMIVNGKDLAGVQSELGGDLLGVGEDDPAVGEFARWLFEQVNSLSAPQQQSAPAEPPQQDQQPQPIPSTQDAQMEDSATPADVPYVSYPLSDYGDAFGAYAENISDPYPDHDSYEAQMHCQRFAQRRDPSHFNQQLTRDNYRPTGPKSMRNGGPQRGRGGRMLGQMNRQMNHPDNLPDHLRRIRGAAGGQSGRINAHAGRDGAPRGPRNSNVANGVQRMMNGGRGGKPANMNPMSQMMNGGPMTPDAQMQFMQMMEMSAQMMAQAMQQNGVNMNGGGFQRGGGQRGGRGGQRGGRGAHSQPHKLHAVDGKMPEGALPGSETSGMDVDGAEKSGKFSTMCRFNLSCTNPACEFAHQSPAAPPNMTVDMSDTCSHGAACTNHKCSARHPSPAQRNAHKDQAECKFYPNCTNQNCQYRHPNQKPCTYGGDCTTPNCKFAHPKIMCRYNPCLDPNCRFKHAEGQKRGKFEDKVWTAEGGEGGKTDRFAGFSQNEGQQEELIIPGQQNGQTGNGGSQENSSSQAMETQIVT